MSNDPYNPEAKPAPPSRAYRSPKVETTAPAPAQRSRPPMPKPPKLEPEVVDTPPVANDYSPYQVLPPRQLPEIVFKAPGSSNQQEAKQSRSKASIVAAAVSAVAVLIVGTVVYGALSRVTEGNLLQGQMTSSAQIGQCYTDQVRFVSCDSAHVYEVFGRNQLPQRSDYPGVISRSLGSEECEFRFFDYVGIERNSSPLAIYSVYPTEDQWADGERWEICVLSNPSLEPLIGSAAASIS